jgi:hypothetical protein
MQDGSVGIGTGYGLDDRGNRVWVPIRSRFFSSDGSETHLASYPMGTGGSLSGGKTAGASSWPLNRFTAEAKNTWVCTSTPPYAFMA